ncbi:MAG: ECF transporter S component [Eubacteriales bacterium]|nr:ECF transporter S component [Eubacteriales bacterium]
MKQRFNTAYMTYVALMVALATILSYFPEIPLAFFAPWLKLDFSFVPMLLIGFSFGPGASILALIITNLIHMLGTQTAGVGELANILVGAAYLLPPTIMYQKNRSKKTAVLGSCIGVILQVVMGVVTNKFLLIPALLGEQAAQFDMVNYLITGIVPFNIVKGSVNSLITFLLYKHLSVFIKKLGRKACGNVEY